MKNNKYKILVLSDLKKSTSTIIKSSVGLAKMIDGEISLFHVKKHIDIVKRDNQFSAMRTLNEEHNNTKKQIEALVNDFSKAYDVKVSGNYAFGKIKEEIQKQIKLYNPDIIVLGQRDSNPLKLFGDSITRFILKKFKGIIMIASNENALVPNEKMTLGVLNGSNKIFSTEFSKDIITHTKAPLKSFRILNSQEESDVLISNEGKMVEYVFEQNDNAMTTLASYLQKNNINLLCVDREKDRTNAETSLKEVVNKLNVSLLVSEA
ncbi:universal stress protein [Winogradskyella thalassocola]|uniref:Nucleotide-binding universal stress protein, UspA family n=1 Tax=Winogradskyella thalassocola TaxID=262004 RepID=A0A1G7XKK8_9FLAO|nr:universal stress protein [Winogradskyella thalassocola]SDG84593.1 Nucleotide-binding universal stress protein, UspA family [Winogradskyella thalassocola]